MKKIFLSFIILVSSLYAELSTERTSQKILDSKMPIVDIRTPGEWKETGMAKGAIGIMFFDEKGGYNVEAFLKELNAKVDTKKQFALICRTGSRTKVVANFLSVELKYNVIDLADGMMYYNFMKFPLVPYK
ncbi:MAG: rhodanese-like domain-containing protein [Campylobacterales bacterium]|nr:rhodanese-like domain-containing protein [Campylobacterales bacterium]